MNIKSKNPSLPTINRQSMAEKWRARMKSPLSFVLYCLVMLSAVIVAGIILFIIAYILVKGIPSLAPEMFEWKFTTENCSMLPALFNTLIMIVMTLMISVPIGIFSAIYLVEYAKKGNRLVSLVRMTTETLAGIPSIVYGLFGNILFLGVFKWGYSLIAGVLTLSIMILPLIIRTTEEALLSVPDLYREGSFGLGAGKLRTVFRVVLPSAAPGIFSGIILAVGRIVGESAALIFTSGCGTRIATSLFDSAGTLSVYMYMLMDEGLSMDAAYAVAAVLLIFVFIINLISGFLSRRMEKKTR